ncbi:MAG: hypothetical protein WCG10_03975, partial [Chlamydiota bacterium]
DLLFYTYPSHMPASLEGYVILYLDDFPTPVLSKADVNYGLFFLDSTWNYETSMHKQVKNRYPLIYRSLPANFVTAYPRKQTDCPDPDRGLATVEAMYIAYRILQRDASHLLKHYYWKNEFLTKNAQAFELLEKSQ